MVVWAWAGIAAGSYDEYMSCGNSGGGGRGGFGRNFHYRPEVPCDLSRNAWCESAGGQYPWQSVRRFVYENQGLMKRMYGDQRHISVLRTELMDNMFEEMSAPNVYRYQPQPPESVPSSNTRNSKKIKRNGRGGARAMEVTMEPDINKNVPNGKTPQKKNSSSSSKVYSRVPDKGSGPDNHQKVPARNRPPKAPPSERRRIPVKNRVKTKSKVDRASATTSSSTTDTTVTSKAPINPSTSPETTMSIKDETTKSSRTTKQMHVHVTTLSDNGRTDPDLETTVEVQQDVSDTTASINQSSTTEVITTNVQDTIEPTTDNPSTTSGDETTVEIDSFTTVEEGTETEAPLQAEFRDGAGPILYDDAYEEIIESFLISDEPIGGPSRHRDTLTTAPGNTQETFSSYTSISSDAAPPSSLRANTPSLSETSTKEYDSSTARSEFPLDFEDDFLSASHDDGDLETIIFEENLDDDPEDPIPLSLEERIAQDYKSSTEGSDLTTLTLAERIDQAVEVRITGSSYTKDEIDIAMEETLADDDSFPRENDEEEEEETEGEEGENVENVSKRRPEPVQRTPLKGINACPVKEEVVAPYWANNTRGDVLALLNLYPFEQYVHWEKCTHENRQMYCRNGCRCEQQYRLHRLLAFDPSNECRGIFSDWFRFPSCCVCKCYNLHHNIFEGSSRRPRLQSTPDDEYFDEDEDEYYYDDEEKEEYDIDRADFVDDEQDYTIEDFNLEQFENPHPEDKTARNQRSHTGSVQPSKIPPQRAPRPYSPPKSHIAPPSPSLLPPSPNLLPPPTTNFIKNQGRYHDSTTRVTVDTATPTVYHNLTWIRENGRALPLFRIPRNAPENEENEKQEE